MQLVCPLLDSSFLTSLGSSLAISFGSSFGCSSATSFGSSLTGSLVSFGASLTGSLVVSLVSFGGVEDSAATATLCSTVALLPAALVITRRTYLIPASWKVKDIVCPPPSDQRTVAGRTPDPSSDH